MKNLHLLPTEKPSKLVKIYNDVNRETFTLKLNVEVNDSFKEYVNVYITSDEEIKDVRPHKGKWHLEKENILNKFPDYLTDLSECKLVIMTTDDDLINDGVQVIDDEFLEWFVKNPSCEFVMTIPDVIGLRDVFQPTGKDLYKIIIPKEESTFYTKKCKCMIFEPNCFTGMCKNCGGILKEEPKQDNIQQFQERIKSLDNNFKEQENTLEEIVIKNFNEEYIKIDLYDSNDNFIGKLDRNQYIDVRIQAYMKNIKGLYVVYPDGEKGFINHENGAVSYFQEGLWNTALRLSRLLMSLQSNDIKNQNRIVE